MTTASEPEVVVSARIERDDRQRLKRLAAQEDRTVSTLVRRAVREYLADRPDEEEVNR